MIGVQAVSEWAPSATSSGTASRRIGEPIHERELTDALVARASNVLRPGPGRSVFVLEEAALGAGRPDVVLLSVNTGALGAFRRTGLRLPSAVAARVLDPAVEDIALGISRPHARTIRRNLTAAGWSSEQADRHAKILSDSLAIEAKIKDWRQAIRQVSKFRRYFRQSAVLMPRRRLPDESTRAMNFYGCGLLFEDSTGIRWERGAISLEPETWTRLWLLELLVRGLENGQAYKATEARNAIRPSR